VSEAVTRVAYLGPPGTFGEEAARRFAPMAEHVPFPSHATVVAAVEAGKADAGVVAVENAINGSVAETLDILIHETDLLVQFELMVPVELNLIVQPGTKMEEVRLVTSHPHALGQCRKFLERELPGAQVEAALSTTDAVVTVMGRNGDAAAIATDRAAEIYGAEVAARGIHDTANNMTRFLVLGHERAAPTGRDRTSIAFTFADDRPGSLAGVLNEFATSGINCSKIESRPTREAFGEYVFLIDFDRHREDPDVVKLLERVRELTSSVKIMGSYPRWQRQP
jgi:prephenate dehydratase